MLRDEGTHKEWEVQLRGFQISARPVTNSDWAQVMNVPLRGEPTAPVVDVSWVDALSLCNRLSLSRGLDECYVLLDEFEAELDQNANGFRLPSEAEWEYSSRAGTEGERYGELDRIAWYEANSEGTVQPVEQKDPNAWGLYDTIGNVWEWCWDLYDGAKYGRYRVFRGGGWSDPPRGCRASCRRKSHPSFHIDDLGFRLARNAN